VLKFLPTELSEGKKFLRNLGIQEKDKFVCINVRDSSFLQKSQPLGWSKSKDWSYHDYRDSRIANYLSASEKLAELGYHVFRMGAIVSQPLVSKHSRVFDYATNGMRTEFLDVFLGAHCEFCISTGSGWDEIPGYFRRPRMYVNIIPPLAYQALDRDLMLYPKILINPKNNNQFTLEEIIKNKVHQICNTVEYAERGITIRDMSSEELVEAFAEMAARVEGTYVETPEQKQMQAKINHILSNHPKLQPTPNHFPIRAKFASCFLSSYPNFLD
jgi:putative glycosyltransferase (TIGR04372 family)